MIRQIESQRTQSYIDAEVVRIEGLVRLRAYELYEKRGREHGHDVDDWLQAESEIVQQRTKAATA